MSTTFDPAAAEQYTEASMPLGDLPQRASLLGAALQELALSLDQRLLETEYLSRITDQINQGLLLDEVLDNVFETFRGVIPYDRIGFSLISGENDEVVARWARSAVGEMLLGAGYRASLEGSSLQKILETGEPRVINDLEAYLAEKPESESTRLIVAEGFRSSLTCPLIVNGIPVGFMFFSSCVPGRYDEHHVDIFRSIAGQLSVIVEKGRMASDLDARKQEMERQNDALRRLDSIKNRFLGMVAHDLRNPIASIQMSAELLADPDASMGESERETFLSDINRQATYMVALIDDLLDVTKIESGRLDLHWEVIHTDAFLTEAVRRHANLAIRKNIDLTLESDTVGTVRADAKRLRQVLDNLLSNAVKFSPAGSTIKVHHFFDGGLWTVEVIDQGPGLNDADRQAVFEYFTTLSSRPTGGENSTGLGMAITRRIIEAHGGEVGVDSQPGSGSTFWFTLPA